MKYASHMKYAVAYEGKFYFISEGNFIAEQLHIARAILHYNLRVVSGGFLAFMAFFVKTAEEMEGIDYGCICDRDCGGRF